MACGQEGHFRPDCPLVPQDKRIGTQLEGSQGPQASAQPKIPSPKRPPVAKATVGLSSTGAVEPSSQVQEALIAEAAKILKGVTLKTCQLRASDLAVEGSWDANLDLGWLVGAVASASDPSYALVDSGATNALRPARCGELSTARVIQVDLASGAAELHISKHGTLLSASPCQVILPAGYLVQMGYVISWRKKGCVIQKPGAASLEVKVVKGCPLIPREVGLRLLDDYEALREGGNLVSLKKDLVKDREVVSPGDTRQWLAQRIAQGKLTRQDQLVWLESMFPEVPSEVLLRTAGLDVDLSGVDLCGVPWNRRKRRSVWKASPRSVLVHLFSGAQRWKCSGPVIEVEKTRGADMLDSGVWQHLLSWAFCGVIGAVIGGPPCRTVSACRSETDGGPPPVRGRAEGRWGLPNLPGHLCDMVLGDSVLWMRTLLLYAVAQASAEASNARSEVKGPGEVGIPQPSAVSPPAHLRDPVSLAQWAIQQAAKNLTRNESAEAPCGRPYPASTWIFFAWEHPRDSSEYMDPEREPSTGWASWSSFKEWQDFRDLYQFHEAKFDQGKLGHVRPKPATMATSSWFLFEDLHGQCLTDQERSWFGKGPADVSGRVWASSTWSKWAPGLTYSVLRAWHHWESEHASGEEVQVRQHLLAKMTEEEAMKRHVANDHTPFKKGCAVCIAAQGRQRSHWRSKHKGVYSLSCDLAGPYVLGQGYDPVASGRDKGHGYRYFLACAFTLPLWGGTEAPVTGTGPSPGHETDPVERGDGSFEEPSLAPDIPRMEDLFPPELEPLSVVQSAVSEKAVTHRVRFKRPEASDVSGTSAVSEAEPFAEPPLPPPADPPELVVKTLCLGVPLRSKKGKEVLPAVQAVVNRLEASGFPVHRYHADRAKELRSAALVSWCRSSGIYTTWTPGDSPAGNKAELSVQQLKSAARKLLSVAGMDIGFWPLAVLHASNRNWCNLCNELGIPQPTLLPFGSQLQARKRVSTGFPSHWRSRTVSAMYLGQAPSTPGGHLVWVADDKGGNKVMLTNTVYPVAPPVGSFKPTYRIRGKRAPSLLLKTVGMEELAPSSCGQVPQAPPGGEWGNSILAVAVEQQGLSADDPNVLNDSDGEEASGVMVCSGVEPQNDISRDLETPQVWTTEKCLEVLREWRDDSGTGGTDFEGMWTSVGLGLVEVEGRDVAIKEEFPVLTKVINRFLLSRAPESRWTSLQIGCGLEEICNQGPEEHPDFPVYVMALGDLQGGGLWVESASNKGSVLRSFREGSWKVGSIWDIQGHWVRFPGGHRRILEPWVGKEVWVMKAFVHVACTEISEGCCQRLRDLGFAFPERGVRAVRRSGAASGGEWQELVSEGASWEVDFPHELWSAESQSEWLRFQRDSAQRCRRIATDLIGAPCEFVGAVSRALLVAQAEQSFGELVLDRHREAEDHTVALKSLQIEVPLNDVGGTPPDQFLQTRTISLEEARAELPLWLDAAREEVQALESVTEAVERITSQKVGEMIKEGKRVIQIPGKAVLTRKSGVGKRRFRAVCCSNHAPASELNLTRADLYAGGVDSLTVRIVLSFVFEFDEWMGCSIDIKTAFLNAPVNGGAATEGHAKPLIVVKPPHLLVQLGLLSTHHRWLVRKALYGLQTSPRDWSIHRDQLLRKVCMSQPLEARLVQSVTDENLWMLKGTLGTLHALVIIYVDDMAIFGRREHVEALVQEIQRLWKISAPSWPQEGSPIMFCGMELWRFAGGWKITQRRYLQELLQRFQVKGSCAAPMTRWEEPKAEDPSPEEIKEAQAITGALLWSVTRTRPDLSFTVSRMAQYATKTPKQVKEWGMQALRYVGTVMDLGLEFKRDPGPLFGHESQLALPRDGESLEIYSDASHSPGGDRSLQCIILSWRGCLLVWEATRQSFVTLVCRK